MRFLILAALWTGLLSPVYAANQTQDCYQSSTSSGFFGSNSCNPAIQAAKSVAINIAASATTQIVAGVANQAIFITSWNVMAAGTNNVTLVYGTGTNCATGQVALTGAYPLIAQAGIATGNGLGPILYVPQGNALCVTTSGSGQLSGSASYVQF